MWFSLRFDRHAPPTPRQVLPSATTTAAVSSGHRLPAFQKASLNSTAKCPVEALKVRQSSTVAAYAFNRLSNGQFSMDCHKNWKATSSGGELTASQTASTNSTAKGLIYVFQNRRSSSAAAYAFNRLSSHCASLTSHCAPTSWSNIVKTNTEVHQQLLNNIQLSFPVRLIAISPLTPPTATTDNSTLSAHCGPQNKNLGVNIKIWFFCPEVIQYPKKTLLGSNWCAESNGNTCRCVAVTVLEKKSDLVWYSAHSAPQIINSGAK